MSDFLAEPLAIAERTVRTRKHRFIDYDEYMDEAGPWYKHELVIGSNRTLYDSCHHTSLWDYSYEPYPIHTMAKPYLAELERLQGGYVPAIHDSGLFTHQPPLYYPRSCSGELACVDLVAAYWQLYRVATLDLSYDGVHTPRQGRIKFLGAEELKPHRLFRNSVIGFCRAEVFTRSIFGTVESVQIGPRWQRPELWAWLMDTLEAVAWEVRFGFGARHIQIDGYIVPADRASALISYLASEWGLEASVRASGPGKITGLGNWTIGDVSVGSAEIAPEMVPGTEHVDNMVPRNWNHLREWYLESQSLLSENLLTGG